MFSIVIPTCNRADLLIKCLDLLSPVVQSLHFSEYEVIVTDDSTDDLTSELIKHKFDWVTVVNGPRKGPAANRNNGAEHAEGEWLIFIDDDCLPDKDILKHYMIACVNNPQEQVFEGAIFPDSWDLLKKDLAECPVNIHGSCFWSANICIKKSLFKQIKGFDESYLIAAQEDQQIKLDIENYTKKEIVFLEHCFVIHPVRFSKVIDQIRRIPILSKNFSIYAFKNKSSLNYKSTAGFCIQQYLFHLKSAVFFLKSGKFKSALVSLAWLLFGIPLNITNILLEKRKPLKNRLV